jgi:membrane protease YdiL (CAAX protease family)
MHWFTLPLIVLLSYALLYLSVLLLWLPGKGKVPRWVFTLAAAIFFGLLSQQIEPGALFSIVLLALAVYVGQIKQENHYIRLIALMGVFVLGYAMLKHFAPGFHRLNVLDHVQISRDAIPFSLSLDFDKTIAGILILGLGSKLITKKSEWQTLFKLLLKNLPLIVFMVIMASLRYRLVTIDVKLPDSILIWSVVNLLCVSAAEEAYYRGFLQNTLASFMGNTKYANYAAIGIAGFMFGLDHYPASINYISLVTAAGIGYGWIYFKTKRIEGSILTHFSVNLIHFIFFTYPVLA